MNWTERTNIAAAASQEAMYSIKHNINCHLITDIIVVKVSHKELSERAIKLTVYDVDRMKRHVIIGYLVYPLTNYEYDEKIIFWRDLNRELIQVSQPAAATCNPYSVRLIYGWTYSVFESKSS